MSYRPYREVWLRCNHCRTRRTSIQLLFAHAAKSPECKPCNCGGYHFTHRRGSPYCYENPMASFRHALRGCTSNEDELDILMDMALELKPTRKENRECPF